MPGLGRPRNAGIQTSEASEPSDKGSSLSWSSVKEDPKPTMLAGHCTDRRHMCDLRKMRRPYVAMLRVSRLTQLRHHESPWQSAYGLN